VFVDCANVVIGARISAKAQKNAARHKNDKER
jgi:hypothetical protein